MVFPPTNARQSTDSLRTSASLSCPPDPLTSETGNPQRRAMACASESAYKLPSVGVFEITELPARSYTSTACISTDMG